MSNILEDIDARVIANNNTAPHTVLENEKYLNRQLTDVIALLHEDGADITELKEKTTAILYHVDDNKTIINSKTVLNDEISNENNTFNVNNNGDLNAASVNTINATIENVLYTDTVNARTSGGAITLLNDTALFGNLGVDGNIETSGEIQFTNNEATIKELRNGIEITSELTVDDDAHFNDIFLSEDITFDSEGAIRNVNALYFKDGTTQETAPHLYLLTFNIGDYFASFLVNKNIGNITLEIAEEDEFAHDYSAFLTQLRNTLIPFTTALTGEDGASGGRMNLFYNGVYLYINLDGYDTQINLNNFNVSTAGASYYDIDIRTLQIL